jgi:CheY-like chemotaxis protein
VRNGKEALAHLNNAAENNTIPHLAILDVNMPQIIGCDVLKALRKDKRFDGLKIVMLTTSDCALRKHCCYENGADIFIRKKIDINDFVEQIQWLKGFWHDTVKSSAGNPEEYRNNRTSL